MQMITRYLAGTALALSAAVLTPQPPPAPAAPIAVIDLAAAQFLVASRTREVAFPGEGFGLARPDVELTDLGRGPLVIYRATRSAGGFGPILLVGYDGVRAIPLGGFAGPELRAAAEVAGLRLDARSEPLQASLAWLAAIADPNGGWTSEPEVVGESAADTAVGLEPAPDDPVFGRGACVSVRSLQKGWANSTIRLLYCFQAAPDGRLLTWNRETLDEAPR